MRADVKLTFAYEPLAALIVMRYELEHCIVFIVFVVT